MVLGPLLVGVLCSTSRRECSTSGDLCAQSLAQQNRQFYYVFRAQPTFEITVNDKWFSWAKPRKLCAAVLQNGAPRMVLDHLASSCSGLPRSLRVCVDIDAIFLPTFAATTASSPVSLSCGTQVAKNTLRTTSGMRIDCFDTRLR